MNFAVIPFDDPAYDLLERVQRVDQSAYVSYAPRVYFVRFDGTAASLAAAIGFTAESNQQIGLILPTKGGFGYADSDLWDWLKK